MTLQRNECGAEHRRQERPADQELYLRIASGQIAFLKFIFEGYDGLAVLSTMDADTGLVRLLYPASRGPELFSLLEALAPGLGRIA